MAIFLSSNEKETRGTVGKAVSGEEFADFILQSMLDMWQNGWKKLEWPFNGTSHMMIKIANLFPNPPNIGSPLIILLY